MDSDCNSSPASAERGKAVKIGKEPARADEHEDKDISQSTFGRINIQNTPMGKRNGVPLTTWLQRTKINETDCDRLTEDETLQEWLRKAQVGEEQRLIRGQDLEERLRVAIAVTKALDDINNCGRCLIKISLENIILDITDDRCEATIDVLDERNKMHSGRRTEEAELKQLIYLGHVLNVVFGGESYENQQAKSEQSAAKKDHPIKKRGKNHETTDHSDLPLYLACLLSSLLSHKASPRGGAAGCRYSSVEQVLRDLQIAAEKPGVYLTKGCSHYDDRSLRIPHDSFYGRRSELALVLHSLDTVLRFGQPMLCTVSGYAGAGKTALLNQVKRPLLDAGGFMIRGKFDKATPPNTVIFSAIDSFFGEINNGDVRVQGQLKLRIAEFVGYGLGILMNAIPNLRVLIEGDEPSTDEEYNIEETTVSHQRWKFLLCRLINAISDESRPLAFFMDDLHWCDEVTLDMIQMIVMDSNIQYCLYLGTYRPVESGITKTLESIQSHGVRVLSIKVSCIEKESVNSLISENLCIPPSLCQSLSTIVHSKTGGFILFATNFLQSLHEEGMIRFDLNARKWEYNVNDIRQRKLSEDVVQHLSERMTRLPHNIQSLLKIASCLGFEFDAELLQMAMKVPMAELVPYAIDSGFLQEIPSSSKIVWAHDQIHLAAYELIPLNKRQSSHLLIGSRIYMNAPTDEVLYNIIFDIVNNMNVGLQLITSQEHMNEAAQLNLTAGRKAVAASSFDAAAEYFMVGVGLLAEDCWKLNYELALVLHQEASDALLVAGNFANLEAIIDEQLAHAKSLDDKLQAYYCLVRFLNATSNMKQAMEKTRFILGELGVTFPEETPKLIYQELCCTKALLSNLTKHHILEGPKLEDKRMLWTMRFMHRFLQCLFSTRPSAMPLVACRMIRMSLEHGYSGDSAMGFATYGWTQLNISQDIEESYKWAKRCLIFPMIFSTPALLPKVKCFFYIFSSFLKEPIQASCDMLLETHRDLLMVGDVEVATMSLFNHCRQMLFAGVDLATIDKRCALATSEMTKLTQIQSYLSHSSHHLIILKLVGKASTTNLFEAFSGVLSGEIRNEDDLLQHTRSTGKTGVVQAIHFNRLFLAYWFKRYEEAAEMATLYKSRTMMPLIDIYHAFYGGLTAFHFARRSSEDGPEEWLRNGEKYLSCFKTWATHSNWNWSNKLLLLEAECHFSKGRMDEAEERYDLAIKSARQHRFVHEEGLANELFSAFHTSNGNVDEANHHISEARACYENWGAFAIVELLDSFGQ